ncbi:MAG: GxxExxY protein [Bacteroidales bacterium]|nr:GxxExxY protein [Bacteroidales bacterium]
MLNVISEEYTRKILACAIAVHKELGPGLLENVYEEALSYELRINGFNVQRQVAVPIIYKGQKLQSTLTLDLLIDDKVIIELKSVEVLKPVFSKQILTYLKLTGKELGYLINFNVPKLMDGVERIVNKYQPY